MTAKALGNRERIESFLDSSGLVETALEDRALVEAARRDRATFALLYDRYLSPIHRYCLLRLQSREMAEDATSIIFIKALTTIETCRPDRFRSWLFTIARNVVIDCYRNQRPVDSIASVELLVDPRPNPLDGVLMNDDERFVIGLLSQLSADQREVVALRLSGLTGAEIAATTGKSKGAIRIAQFRAYARLRELVTSLQTSNGEE